MALRVFPRISQKALYVAVAAGVALLIALPFLLSNATFFLTPFLYQGSTGPWQTVWALLDGYYSGGETTPLETRFDPTNIAVSFHQSTFPYGIVAAAFLVIYFILYTRRIDWQDNLKVVAFCGLSISLFLVFSKGYSPQWIVNLLPFIVLLLPDLRGVTYSILLMGANVLEFPVAMVLLAEHPWLFATAVVLRTALLVLVGMEFGLILFEAPRLKRAIGLALASVVLLMLLGGLPVAALAVRDYSAERYEESAYHETTDYLRGQPAGGVIFTDQLLYQQVYSFLARRHGLFLVEANESLPDALARLEGRHSSLYVVYTGSEADQNANPAVESWLSQHTFPTGVKWLENARVSSYSTTVAALVERPLQTRFEDGIELATCAFPTAPFRPGEVLPVSLTWRALEMPAENYTVFVHLIDESQRVWAQHDGEPVGGSRSTSSWHPGEEVTDHHGLALPSDLLPGEYSLAVGLYDAATGERLPVDTAEGTAPSDRVLVGPVLIN